MARFENLTDYLGVEYFLGKPPVIGYFAEKKELSSTEPVLLDPMRGVELLARQPYLVALTPASLDALGGRELLIPVLPFRVGREGREPSAQGGHGAGLEDRRRGAVKSGNDLYIREAGQGKFLSQEHFFIDQNPDGTFSLVDRGSTLGTLVEGLLIGGEEKGGTVQLFHGAVIIPGGQDSPYVFRFEIREPGGAFRKTDSEIA